MGSKILYRDFVYSLFFWLDHALPNRVGYGLMGFYNKLSTFKLGVPQFNNPEDLYINDLDHLAAGVIILFLLKNYFGDELSDLDFLDLIEEHLVHELGEVTRGDEANNGSLDLKTKEKEEYEIARRALLHFPKESRDKLDELYCRNMRGEGFGKLIDRICFVWGIGWLYHHGIGGSMSAIPQKGTNDDVVAEIAGSDCPFDAMFVDFINFSRNYSHRELFIGITEEMYRLIFHRDVPERIKELY